MPTLHRNAHFSVIHQAASAYVIVARTSAHFGTHGDATRTVRECASALQLLDVRELGVLLDYRRAPLSTDLGLQEIIVRESDAFIRRFARRALLVQTAIGAMQSGRIVRVQSTTQPAVFDDEAAAVAHVSR